MGNCNCFHSVSIDPKLGSTTTNSRLSVSNSSRSHQGGVSTDNFQREDSVSSIRQENETISHEYASLEKYILSKSQLLNMRRVCLNEMKLGLMQQQKHSNLQDYNTNNGNNGNNNNCLSPNAPQTGHNGAHTPESQDSKSELEAPIPHWPVGMENNINGNNISNNNNNNSSNSRRSSIEQSNSFLTNILTSKKIEKSTLQMLSTHVFDIPNGNETGVYYALDWGGTNYRVTKLYLLGRKWGCKTTQFIETIEDKYKQATNETILFDHLAQKLKELMIDQNDRNISNSLQSNVIIKTSCTMPYALNDDNDNGNGNNVNGNIDIDIAQAAGAIFAKIRPNDGDNENENEIIEEMEIISSNIGHGHKRNGKGGHMIVGSKLENHESKNSDSVAVECVSKQDLKNNRNKTSKNKKDCSESASIQIVDHDIKGTNEIIEINETTMNNNSKSNDNNNRNLQKPRSINILNKNENESKMDDNNEKKKSLNDELHRIGFCFSFPIIQTALNKGILVEWNKGFTVPNVVNKDVSQLMNDAFKRLRMNNVKIDSIVNDTVGTLLSCAYEYANTRIGVILGTGTNCAYIDPTCKNEIINTEWGNFGSIDKYASILCRCEIDYKLDAMTDNPDCYLCEKMTSGKYLGELARLASVEIFGYKIRRYKQDSILNIPWKFTSAMKTQLVSMFENENENENGKQEQTNGSNNNNNNNNLLDFDQINDFIKNECGLIYFTIDDIKLFAYICKVITYRSAGISAAMLAAVLEKTGLYYENGVNSNQFILNKKYTDNHNYVTVGIDGSLYNKDNFFQHRFNQTLKWIIGDEIYDKVKIVQALDGSGKGAALAAACNRSNSNRNI